MLDLLVLDFATDYIIEKTTSDPFQLFGLIMSTSTNFEDSRNYCCKIPSDMMWEAQDISKYNIIETSISISMLSRRPGQHENLQEMIGDGNQRYSEINGNHSSYKFGNQEIDRFQVCLTRDGRPHPRNSESLIKGLWVAACEPSSRRSPGRKHSIHSPLYVSWITEFPKKKTNNKHAGALEHFETLLEFGN